MNPYYTDEAVTLYHGDCIDVMRALPDNSVDAVVTDPPYGINFMGRAWDGAAIAAAAVNGVDHTTTRERSASMHAGSYDVSLKGNRAFGAWCELWAVEAFRVLKPGGHLLAFSSARTWHRLTAAVEDSGFEIRDSIAWMYGSGFPKSLDVSKAIDKKRDETHDAERRDVILTVTSWVAEARNAAGLNNRQIDEHFGTNGMAGHWTSSKSQPSVPTAEQWPRLLELFGVDEPPQEVRDAVDEWLRIKGQPAPTWSLREVTGHHEQPAAGQQWNANYGQAANLQPKERRDKPATEAAQKWQGWGTALKPAFEPVVVARKPLAGTVAANVQQYGTGALNIDGCRIATGDRFGGGAKATGGFVEGYEAGDGWTPGSDKGRWPANVILDEHQASRVGDESRFFYTAKASSAERPKDGDVAHPTVKPLDLMRYLVRLVTPPGGTVLEPFAGSGTTAEACIVEGFKCIAIEMTDDYLPLILQRITKPIEMTLL